jgi:hypothetical protein
MALGDVTDRGHYTEVEILASATATNGPPSGATAGIEVNALKIYGEHIPDVMALKVYSTAGSGSMTCDLRLWTYSTTGTVWLPPGTGTGGVAAGAKGSLNGGVQITETEADKIQHVELVQFLEHFDRLYLEIVGIGGTSTAITGILVIPRQN